MNEYKYMGQSKLKPFIITEEEMHSFWRRYVCDETDNTGSPLFMGRVIVLSQFGWKI